VVYPAVAGVAAPAAAAAVAVAPEEMVRVELLVSGEAEEVGPSSMVETVLTQRVAMAGTSVVAMAATTIMAMAPLAPAAAEVEED